MASVAAVALACLLTAPVVLTAPDIPDDTEATLKIVYADHPRPASSLPQVIHYRVATGENSSFLLRLKRRDVQLDSVPVFARQQNQITRVNLQNASNDVVGFYQGDDTKTAVALKVKAEPNATCHEMSGTFYQSNSWMSILPASAKRHGARQGSIHLLRKLKSVQTDYSYERPPNGSRAAKVYRMAKLFAEARRRTISSGPLRRSRQTQPRHNVGILIVVEYSAYKRIAIGLKRTNPSPTVDDVLREVRFYCAHAENMVNVRYRNIDASIVSIRTTLKAIYVETSLSGNYWLDKWTVPGADPQRLSVDSNTTLTNFTSWINANLRNFSLPSYDHASLFTGYDLSGYYNGIYYYGTTGIAFVGSACTSYGTSVVEMTGALGEGYTLAHELGHSLGANHDGQGNDCPATDQYIMTPITSATSGAQSYNPFRFSSCSQTAMAAYIQALNSYGINCLLNDEQPYNATEWRQETAVLPGLRYSASEQCKQLFGPTYSVCGGAILGSNVCSQRWCYDTTAATLRCLLSDSSSKAMDGTPCGDKKWCERGSCVYNAAAPAGSDTCPLGDTTKELPVFSDLPNTCSSLPPYFCYYSGANTSCCKTCADHYNPARPYCPYGDRANCSAVTLFSCRYSSINTTCCGFCSDNMLPIPGCPYGDYYSDCRSLAPQICSVFPAECCETCAATQNATATAAIAAVQPTSVSLTAMTTVPSATSTTVHPSATTNILVTTARLITDPAAASAIAATATTWSTNATSPAVAAATAVSSSASTTANRTATPTTPKTKEELVSTMLSAALTTANTAAHITASLETMKTTLSPSTQTVSTISKPTLVPPPANISNPISSANLTTASTTSSSTAEPFSTPGTTSTTIVTTPAATTGSNTSEPVAVTTHNAPSTSSTLPATLPTIAAATTVFATTVTSSETTSVSASASILSATSPSDTTTRAHTTAKAAIAKKCKKSVEKRQGI